MTAIVTIAVPTFRRPQQLERLLESLTKIEQPESAEVELVVIDNDKAQSGKTVFNKMAAMLPFHAEYHVETRRGVTHVRNSLLNRARGDFIAFIDDDEYVERNWLTALLQVMDSYRCDAVVGQVVPQFPSDTPPWLISYITSKQRGTTGDLLESGITSSTLIRLSRVRAHGIEFEEQFNLTGGEDTAFFAKLIQVGGSVRYSAESVTIEPIDPQRLRLEWFLTRNFRVGQTNSILYRRENGLMLQLTKALAKLIIGPPMVVMGLACSLGSRKHGLRIAMTGIRCLGFASALIGVRTNEYGGI